MISGRLVDKKGERLPMITGFLMIFVALVILLRADSFLTFAISWVVSGLGGGMLGPAYLSLISKVVPQKMMGTLFSGCVQQQPRLYLTPCALDWRHTLGKIQPPNTLHHYIRRSAPDHHPDLLQVQSPPESAIWTGCVII